MNKAFRVINTRRARETRIISPDTWTRDQALIDREGNKEKNLEFHLLDTGHFALAEDGDLIATYINNFSTNKSKAGKTDG